MLDIQSDQRNAFQETDVNLLESLSITISIAIRNAQLFRAQEWRREVSESYRETADLLTRELKLKDLLTTMLAQIPKLLPVDFCGLWLIDPKSDQLDLKQQFSANKTVTSDSPIGLKSSARENWFHHSNLDLETILKPSQPALDQIATALGMQESYSAIAAPIVSEGKTHGVLTIHTNSPGRYGMDSLKICSTYADYIATRSTRNVCARLKSCADRPSRNSAWHGASSRLFCPKPCRKSLVTIWRWNGRPPGRWAAIFMT